MQLALPQKHDETSARTVPFSSIYYAALRRHTLRKLKKIYIEITNACNLACDFCPRTERLPEFMSKDTFGKILDQIKEHTEHIYFHVKGEPLLHPEIGTFLDICNEKGFQVNITTNGTLIHKVKDMIMNKPALRQMNFSLHSVDGNMNSGNRDEYIERILSFSKEASHMSKIFISLRLWNLQDKQGIPQERERNIEMLAAIEKAFLLPSRIEEEVVSRRGVKIADRIYVHQENSFIWPDLHAKDTSGSAFCHGLRNQAAILVDGTVVPCCLDGEGVMSLGNLHLTPFSEIIEGKRARSIFDGFSRKVAVEELCRKCGYRERFV
jgi:MoaA/NifB/PqqE/SkfB family radical SAM enzyme